MENKIKHLEFIQGVINRMAYNSFLIKGWTITILSALFALGAIKDAKFSFFLIAILPIAVFWGLDGFFLYQEHLYRKLYKKVRLKDKDEVDFSMNTREFKERPLCQWLDATFSKTLIPFYLSILVIDSLIILLKYFC